MPRGEENIPSFFVLIKARLISLAVLHKIPCDVAISILVGFAPGPRRPDSLNATPAFYLIFQFVHLIFYGISKPCGREK